MTWQTATQTTTQLDDRSWPSPPPSGTGRVILLCILLSLLASLAFAITSGELITRFHQAHLKRYADYASFVIHQVNNSCDDIHPAFGYFAERCFTFPIALTRLLIAIGASTPLAINLVVLLIRTIFGTAISTLLLATTRRAAIAVIGVLLAYTFPQNAAVYGYSFHPALTGYFTTSLFLLACALILLRYRRLALAFWALQFWSHPTTFACWAPVFIGFYLWTSPRWKSRFERLTTPYLLLLVIGPLLAGLVAGIVERMGLLPWQGGADYWSLVRVKSCHSVFLFLPGYTIPLRYLSQVVTLFLLALMPKKNKSPIRSLHLLCACGGLGIGFMYLSTVETHFSVLANMCLPLRFESVMYTLIVAAVIQTISCQKRECASETLLATAYAGLLLFPKLEPITWAWSWALGQVWLQSDRTTSRLYLYSLFVGVGLVLGYLILGPSAGTILSNLHIAAWTLPALIILAAAFWICLYVRTTWPRLTIAAGCIVMAMTAPRAWVTDPSRIIAEIQAIIHSQPEDSPQKQACDWIEQNIAPGTHVLVSQSLFFNRISHIYTSLNKDLIEYFLYAPQFAPEMVADMKELYGLDLHAMAKRHERLSLGYEHWEYAKGQVLQSNPLLLQKYKYIIEPAEIPLAEGLTPVFKNSYVKIYEVTNS